MPDRFACDTSVIFNGQILTLIEDGELGEKPEIFISNIVIILNFPNNPMGYVPLKKEVNEIVSFLREQQKNKKNQNL